MTAPADIPVPLPVTAHEPLPVTIEGGVPPKGPAIQSQKHDPSVPAVTTFQEDLTHAGQRQINLIWERTQALVAIMVVAFAMIVNSSIVIILVVTKTDMTAAQTIGLSFVNLICGMVISFYFSRTNHQAIGGTGVKANEAQTYAGR